MGRSLRVECPGGWFHVINRGVERRSILPDAAANRHFVRLLSLLPARFGVRVHAYVPMVNHYHLQLETPRPNLGQALHWLNQSYAGWFNRRHRRVGPLFQGRFKALVHEAETCALTLNRYIHLNPIRVRRFGGHEGRSSGQMPPAFELARARVAALKLYEWSSYPVYAGHRENPGWLTTSTIYACFGEHPLPDLQRAYRRQLEGLAAVGHGEAQWKAAVQAGLLLGSARFCRALKQRFRGNRQEQTALRQAQRRMLEWDQVTAAVSYAWAGPWDRLRQMRGENARAAALFLARHYGGYRLRELGVLAGPMSDAAVSVAVRRFEARLKTHRSLAHKLEIAKADHSGACH